PAQISLTLGITRDAIVCSVLRRGGRPRPPAALQPRLSSRGRTRASAPPRVLAFRDGGLAGDIIDVFAHPSRPRDDKKRVGRETHRLNFDASATRYSRAAPDSNSPLRSFRHGLRSLCARWRG